MKLLWKSGSDVSLQAVYQQYETLRQLVDDARKRCFANPHDEYLIKIKLPFAAEKKKGSGVKNEIGSYFDDVVRSLDEMFFLKLMGEFERQLFSFVKNNADAVGNFVKSEFKGRGKQGVFASRFVKAENDFAYLNIVLNVIFENHVPEAMFGQISLLVDYRNYLAHGKRFHKRSSADFSIITVASAKQQMEEFLKFVNNA